MPVRSAIDKMRDVNGKIGWHMAPTDLTEFESGTRHIGVLLIFRIEECPVDEESLERRSIGGRGICGIPNLPRLFSISYLWQESCTVLRRSRGARLEAH